EVALDFSNRSGEQDFFGDTVSTEVNHQASIRGRVGYAVDRSLFFATAGYGIDNRAVEVNGTSIGGARYHGPMIGIGAETVLSGAWNLRGDLEHYFYGEEEVAGIPTNGDTSLFRMSLVRRF
ncbi:MAG: outer membrane protein, partial [Pararhodobacter sp.]